MVTYYGIMAFGSGGHCPYKRFCAEYGVFRSADRARAHRRRLIRQGHQQDETLLVETISESQRTAAHDKMVAHAVEMVCLRVGNGERLADAMADHFATSCMGPSLRARVRRELVATLCPGRIT